MTDIRHNEADQRFEATVDGRVCWLDYRRAGERLLLVYTAVPPPLQGRGIAGQLVEAALAFARGSGLEAVPQCSYVRSYMSRRADADPGTHSSRRA